MATSTIGRLWPARVLGGLFASGTAAVLFWDVRTLSDITVDHLMTALVLIGTIASGHMLGMQLRAWRVWKASGLGLLFISGTFYCVTASAARNVETSVPKLLERLDINAQRAKLESDIREAKADLKRATEGAERACTSGVGPKCNGASKTRDQADSHYWMLIGRLANTKPAQPANAGLAHAAKVFALLPLTGTAEAIEGALVLLFPFAKALFLEVATIVFFGLGFPPRTDRPAQTASVCQTVLPNSSGEPFFAADPIANKGRNPLAMRRDDAEVDLIAFIRVNGCVPKQEVLRERWGIRSRGTISTWLKEWEELGLISRQQDGRVKITKASNGRH